MQMPVCLPANPPAGLSVDVGLRLLSHRSLVTICLCRATTCGKRWREYPVTLPSPPLRISCQSQTSRPTLASPPRVKNRTALCYDSRIQPLAPRSRPCCMRRPPKASPAAPQPTTDWPTTALTYRGTACRDLVFPPPLPGAVLAATFRPLSRHSPSDAFGR